MRWDTNGIDVIPEKSQNNSSLFQNAVHFAIGNYSSGSNVKTRMCKRILAVHVIGKLSQKLQVLIEKCNPCVVRKMSQKL